jgi:hypothetical protein
MIFLPKFSDRKLFRAKIKDSLEEGGLIKVTRSLSSTISLQYRNVERENCLKRVTPLSLQLVKGLQENHV